MEAFCSLRPAPSPLRGCRELLVPRTKIVTWCQSDRFSVCRGTRVLTGVLFGLATAFAFSRPKWPNSCNPRSSRTTEGRARATPKTTHRILVAGQIALTIMLLTSPPAAMERFSAPSSTPAGYDPHNTISVGLPSIKTRTSVGETGPHYFIQLLIKSLLDARKFVAPEFSSNANAAQQRLELAFEIFGRPSASGAFAGHFVQPRILLRSDIRFAGTLVVISAKSPRREHGPLS